jgi:hypothetical protein
MTDNELSGQSQGFVLSRTEISQSRMTTKAIVPEKRGRL